MGYLVLARKYRPADLAELVGQEHIGRALSNALTMNRIPQALLFCGARGTGKTSTARIIAKMLNCVDGPTDKPCGVCSSCKEIANAQSVDVQELDAASNRGIDEIRELRSGVGYAPSRDRYKVYIVDEAHMLTDQAANAFLKTLEEPPPHVVFVLATTDPQRLPVTIRSRCQRYDFRRVKAAEVVKRLAYICQQEGLKYEEEALYLVAREGDGSMRDSLSVLDQVISFGGGELLTNQVADLLGVADRGRLHQLLQAVLTRNAPEALQAVAAAVDAGLEPKNFARVVAFEARDLLMVRLTGEAARDLVDRSDSELEALRELTRASSAAELERIAHVLLEVAETAARTRYARMALEMGLVRLCKAPGLVDVAELAVRVEGLLASKALLGRGGSGGGVGGGAAAGGFGGGGPPAGWGSGRGAAPAAPQPGGLQHGTPPKPQPLATPQPVRPLARGVGPEHTAVVPGPAGPAGPTTGQWQDADLGRLTAALEAQNNRAVARLLDSAVVVAERAGQVQLGFANTFMLQQASQPESLDAMAMAASQVHPGRWTFSAVGGVQRAMTDSASAKRRAVQHEAQNSLEQRLRDDPAVMALQRAFDAQIVQVSPERTAPGTDATPEP